MQLFVTCSEVIRIWTAAISVLVQDADTVYTALRRQQLYINHCSHSTCQLMSVSMQERFGCQFALSSTKASNLHHTHDQGSVESEGQTC